MEQEVGCRNLIPGGRLVRSRVENFKCGDHRVYTSCLDMRLGEFIEEEDIDSMKRSGRDPGVTPTFRDPREKRNKA